MKDWLTPNEAARELSLATTDVVYRLIRAGTLRAERDERGRWRIPAEAVELRKARVSGKRSSPSFAGDRPDRRTASAFAPRPGMPGYREPVSS